MEVLLHPLLNRIIRIGRLDVTYASGRSRSYGEGACSVALRIKTRGTERALCFNPELAVGEAFMDGDLEITQGTVYDFLELLFKNTQVTELGGVPAIMRKVNFLLRRFRHFNTPKKSRDNVAHHYDLNREFYRLFLDSDSQYSCAYFEDGETTLDEAQLAKKRHLTAKLLVEKDNRVLDIGSGWGGLGLYINAVTGADVTGVTLSTEQHAVSNARANNTNVADQVRFLFKDYRSVEDQFDRIVSVGMFEHVGVGHYDEFFAKTRSLLKPNGVFVLHSIGQFDVPSATNPWIEKYIFPGGYIPTLSEVFPALERQGFVVCDVEILRLHYAETLKAWRERFMARRDDAVQLYDERFMRMWEFYLACCETAFRYQGLMVFQLQLSLDQTAVPLTRRYLDEAETELKRLESPKSTVPFGLNRRA
ncbi:cyclopropane-fatty-acyl-phospholipid synthase family protein [Ensifer sp. YR511]|uniref:SAM-dependent methyltransferase n=1 Tax=Ensifer sp. YR511 TaxID=1855294 RepID=UPI000890709E|nr:cyclopropane-fatty-acyl-phospholipid synthase family protein [Ensifer sp. YR511]SDN05140.1 cyclopropane-fatty-acyl-phospholipid synthase [Ensifer sp. YR511]